MKTKAVFTSILGLTLATSILAGSTAEAQMRTSLAPRKTTAKSQLKAKVAAVEPAKQEVGLARFGLNVSQTYYGKEQNESNYLENWLTVGFKASDNVSLSVETGFDAYMEKQEKNQGYDLEANLVVSGIEIVKDFTLATGLIGVLPTSRDSRNSGMTAGYGARGNLGLKLGGVSLGIDNNFYQFAYKTAPVATPEAEILDDNDKRYYSGEYSRATSVLSAAIPLGPVKWKNDLRLRQSTPYIGEEKRPMRFRTRLSYGITDKFSITGGVYWQKNMIDRTAPDYFANKHRTFTLAISLDV